MPRARRARCRRRRSRGFGMRGQLVDQLDGLLFHVDHVVGDAAAEIAVEEIRRDCHAQARGRAYQRLADAAGHLQRIANARDHDRKEHLDQAEHGAEQAEQRRDQGEQTEQLIRRMQAMGVLSFIFCALAMLLVFVDLIDAGQVIFGISIFLLVVSLVFSLYEILISTNAIEIELQDIKRKLAERELSQ